jgi:hypothetical protein
MHKLIKMIDPSTDSLESIKGDFEVAIEYAEEMGIDVDTERLLKRKLSRLFAKFDSQGEARKVLVGIADKLLELPLSDQNKQRVLFIKENGGGKVWFADKKPGAKSKFTQILMTKQLKSTQKN